MAEKRRRATSAIARDKMFIDIAAGQIAQFGWDAVTFNSVAAESGLSRKPLYDRYIDRSHLGLAVWQRESQDLWRAISELLDSLRQGDSVEKLNGLFDLFIHPSPELVTSVELLLASRFDNLLRHEVDAAARHFVLEHCPNRSEKEFAEVYFTLLNCLGFILGHQRPTVEGSDFTSITTPARYAFQNPAQAEPIERPVMKNWDQPSIDTGDRPLDLLLESTLREIGLHGYAGANVRTIAKLAGTTEGLVYSRYETKREMFEAALSLGIKRALDLYNLEVQKLYVGRSRGLAEAMVWRESMSPSHAWRRSVRLEAVRLTWFSQSAAATTLAAENAFASEHQDSYSLEPDPMLRGNLHWAFCGGYGAQLLPLVWPEAANCHFEILTIPFYSMPE